MRLGMNDILAFWPIPQTQLNASWETQIKVKSEVVFGSPSQNCSGSGICFVAAYRPYRPLRWSCPRTLSLLSSDNPYRFSMHFRREDLSPDLQQKYFNSPVFCIEEPVMLAKSLCKSLGLAHETLPRGTYPIYENEAGWTIVFYMGM